MYTQGRALACEIGGLKFASCMELWINDSPFLSFSEEGVKWNSKSCFHAVVHISLFYQGIVLDLLVAFPWERYLGEMENMGRKISWSLWQTFAFFLRRLVRYLLLNVRWSFILEAVSMVRVTQEWSRDFRKYSSGTSLCSCAQWILHAFNQHLLRAYL